MAKNANLQQVSNVKSIVPLKHLLYWTGKYSRIKNEL